MNITININKIQHELKQLYQELTKKNHFELYQLLDIHKIHLLKLITQD